jgi:hypothetical protein
MIILLCGALCYAISAMTVIFFLRRKDNAYVKANPIDFSTVSSETFDIASGESSLQRTSYHCSIVLLVMLVLILPIAFIVPFLLFFFIILFGIVNAFVVYPHKIRITEAYGLAHNPNSNKIKTQRMFAWITWVSYTIFGLFFLALLSSPQSWF